MGGRGGGGAAAAASDGSHQRKVATAVPLVRLDLRHAIARESGRRRRRHQTMLLCHWLPPLLPPPPPSPRPTLEQIRLADDHQVDSVSIQCLTRANYADVQVKLQHLNFDLVKLTFVSSK